MSISHQVSKGECLSSIAAKHGFVDYRTIYDHADNAEFRKKRPNPNVIYPRDVIQIPDRKIKTVACATGQTHTFVVTRPKVMLRIKLADDEGNAFADKRYQLKVGSFTLDGRTGSDGLIEQPIPADAAHGELVFWLDDDDHTSEGLSFPLELGDLDPPEEVSGAQARLLNLGFDCGGVTGTLDEPTCVALRAFQAASGLEATGALDAATSAKLRQQHEES